MKTTAAADPLTFARFVRDEVVRLLESDMSDTDETTPRLLAILKRAHALTDALIQPAVVAE